MCNTPAKAIFKLAAPLGKIETKFTANGTDAADGRKARGTHSNQTRRHQPVKPAFEGKRLVLGNSRKRRRFRNRWDREHVPPAVSEYEVRRSWVRRLSPGEVRQCPAWI